MFNAPKFLDVTDWLDETSNPVRHQPKHEDTDWDELYNPKVKTLKESLEEDDFEVS